MNQEPFVISHAPATRSYRNQKVRLVASGILSLFEFTPHVFVRMKSRNKIDYSKPVRVKQASDRWVLFDTPDREVLFTRENVTIDGDRPFNDITKNKWDYSFALGFSTNCGDDLPVDRFMINPTAFVNETEPRLRTKDTLVSTTKLITADSGGYQLGYGGMDFVNPEYIVDFYTKNADEGVVLDIPTRALVLKHSRGRELLEKTAKVHKQNALYMHRNLPKEFRLGNVAHGQTLADYDFYRNYVEDTKVDYKFMCIAGTAKFNVVEGCYRTLRTMFSGRQYEHYHLLGLAAPPFIALLSWMMAELGRRGRNNLMTYDASSPIALTVNRGYYSQQAHYSSFDRVNYGEIDSGRKTPAGSLDNPFRMYAMQDPVLNLVGGYMDFIHLWPSHTVRSFMVFANIHSLARYTHMMNHYAEVLSKNEYKDLLADQFRGSKHKALTLVGVDFITYALDEGLDKAFKKFSLYLPAFTGAIQMRPFPIMGEAQEDNVSERSKELLTNITNAINNFSRWHSGKWTDAPKFSKPNRVHKSKNASPI